MQIMVLDYKIARLMSFPDSKRIVTRIIVYKSKNI